jgi:hypothetical protein
MSHMTDSIDAFSASIDALQPPEERTAADKLGKLIPNIELALARGVTQRAIMEALRRDGLKLHPVKFKKLLDQARAQRNESGNGMCCPSCGSVQMLSPASEAQVGEGGEK